MSELRERHQYQAKKNPTSVPNIKKGDIVIVHDESLPRGLWKLGRIQEVLAGRDGLPVHGVHIKLYHHERFFKDVFCLIHASFSRK